MTPHERVESIAEARVFALAAPVILPIIEKRREYTISQLLIAHRERRTDVTTLVAELSVLSDLEREIKQKETMYRTMEEQNATRNRK